jgi:hypothetical protein
MAVVNAPLSVTLSAPVPPVMVSVSATGLIHAEPGKSRNDRKLLKRCKKYQATEP